MRIFFLAGLIIVSACSDDRPQAPTAEENLLLDDVENRLDKLDREGANTA